MLSLSHTLAALTLCVPLNPLGALKVEFASADKTRSHVWATSWGVSTRLLGATVMVHADDEGLVLPPHVAPVQVRRVGGWEVLGVLGEDGVG